MSLKNLLLQEEQVLTDEFSNKLFMKYIITVSFCLLFYLYPILSFSGKNTFTITCDQNSAALSNEFIKNQWVQTPMPWFASWAQEKMNEYLFTGGIRTIKDKYPTDPNPHLYFVEPAIYYDEEQGEVIMCRYKIENSEMMDIKAILEMRNFTYLPEKACFISSNISITCTEN